MCGIAGSFPSSNTKLISAGIKKIKHRGPDDDAVVKTKKGALGHARLSIIDVQQGHQPMANGDTWIAFNGEVYNFLDLKSLIDKQLATNSDTEVVLQLFQQLGPDCVALFDGMFALAIMENGSLFLARDPLGIKPLYYTLAEGTLYFASEIKALYEISSNIEEFPAGHWWHSEYGMRQYHHINNATIYRKHNDSNVDHEVLSSIREKLKNAVEKRMIADDDVPVGVSLSGGLDSSIVAAFARSQREDLNTFVVGVAEGEDLEASFQVANHLETNHHVYQYSLNEMVNVLPEVIYHLESFDAPLIRSAIPNYFLAKLASDHVKVILTGEGADELYAGYEYLYNIDDPDKLQDELLIITENLHNTNLQRADRMSMAHGIEARVPFLDKEFVDFSLALPPLWKISNDEQIEKQLLREACKGIIPDEILNRPKSKFSDGAGSIDLLSNYANNKISDTEFIQHQDIVDNFKLRSKEELFYYQIFQGIFGENLSLDIVGRTRSITKTELN